MWGDIPVARWRILLPACIGRSPAAGVNNGPTNEATRPCLPAGRHRAGLPGNVDMIARSAFLPAYKAGHPADLPVKGGLVDESDY
jgi:hypothetical protein